MTSHMVNLPHGWYPHTRSFFATLKLALVITHPAFRLTDKASYHLTITQRGGVVYWWANNQQSELTIPHSERDQVCTIVLVWIPTQNTNCKYNCKNFNKILRHAQAFDWSLSWSMLCLWPPFFYFLQTYLRHFCKHLIQLVSFNNILKHITILYRITVMIYQGK